MNDKVYGVTLSVRVGITSRTADSDTAEKEAREIVQSWDSLADVGILSCRVDNVELLDDEDGHDH